MRGESEEYVYVPTDEQGPGPGPGGYLPTVPSGLRGDRADLIDKIRPDKIIELIRHRLMGEDFKDNAWIEVPELSQYRLSKRGAWEITNLIMPLASINTTISKLNDAEIKSRLLNICRTAQYLCITNWKDYGVTSSTQLRFVNDIVFSASLVVLKQADEASIQELLKGTVYETRNISQDKPGMVDKIRRGFGL